MEAQKIKQILEAAILAAESPLDRDALLMLFDEAERPDKQQLNKLLEELAGDYAERGVELREVGSGFRFQVRKELGYWVSRLWAERAPRYSRAIMETLSLIAYRQPITRGEIEEIRGVSVGTQIIRTLQERNWVRVVGHRDVPGRPAMFATTKQFLDYFDLKSLDELPPLSEIKDLDKFNEELELEDEQMPAGADMQAEEADEENADAAETEASTDDAPPAANDEGDESGEDATPAGWRDEDPDIDESQLMNMERVDAVLKDVEQSFRKKPEPPEERDEADNTTEGDSDNALTSGARSDDE